MNIRNFIYASACLSFCSIVGAAIYEHVALWPSAFASVPQSLTVFQGPYALNSPAFWMGIHPVTLSFLSLTLIVFWKTERRKHLLITMTGYIAILVTTFVYFVPELLELTGTPYSDTFDQSLTARGSLWITLSLVRGAVLILLALTLIVGLTKPENVTVKRKISVPATANPI